MKKTVCIAFIILVLAVVLQFTDNSFGEASDKIGARSGSSGSTLVFKYALIITSPKNLIDIMSENGEFFILFSTYFTSAIQQPYGYNVAGQLQEPKDLIRPATVLPYLNRPRLCYYKHSSSFNPHTISRAFC